MTVLCFNFKSAIMIKFPANDIVITSIGLLQKRDLNNAEPSSMQVEEIII